MAKRKEEKGRGPKLIFGPLSVGMLRSELFPKIGLSKLQQ